MIANAALLLEDHYFDPPLRLVVVLDEESFVWTQQKNAEPSHQRDGFHSPLTFEGAFFLPRAALESSVGSNQVLRELAELMSEPPLSKLRDNESSFISNNKSLPSKMTIRCPSPIGGSESSRVSAEVSSSIPPQGDGSSSSSSSSKLMPSNARSLPSGLHVAQGRGVSSICLSFSFGRCGGRSRGDPTTCVQAHVNPLVTAALRALVVQTSPLSRSLMDNSLLDMASHIEFTKHRNESQRLIRTAFCRTLYVNLTDNLLNNIRTHLRNRPLLSSKAPSPSPSPSSSSVHSNLFTIPKRQQVCLPHQTPATQPHSSLDRSLFMSSRHESMRMHPNRSSTSSPHALQSTSRQLFPSRASSSIPDRLPSYSQQAQLNTILSYPPYSSQDTRHLLGQCMGSLRPTPNFLTIRSSFLSPTMGWLRHEGAYRVWLSKGLEQKVLPRSDVDTNDVCAHVSIPYTSTLVPEPDKHPLVAKLVKAYASHSLESVSHCMNDFLPPCTSSVDEDEDEDEKDGTRVWHTHPLKKPMWLVHSHDDSGVMDVPQPASTHLRKSYKNPSPSSAAVLTYSTKGVIVNHSIQRFTQGVDLCPSFAIHQHCPLGYECPMLHIQNLDKAARSFRKTELQDLLSLIQQLRRI